MIFVFYSLAAALVLLSIKSLYSGIEYLRFFKRQIAKPASGFTPFATVIAPCRGLDEGLEDNLQSIATQDYPEYEVIFVVDDVHDPAADVIKDIMNMATASTKLVVAPIADACSQKVENLREAVLHADDRSEIFVVVDSDIRTSADWLLHLVAALDDENTGAATGYRWFISEHPSFGSEMRSAWNASIASALGPNMKTNFCWGGSMAIRRNVFERVQMREKWRGALSDDFAVTSTMARSGLEIAFVPQAVTASLEDCTFAQMLEFTTRQMKITRVNGTKFWMLSFAVSGLFIVVMAWAATILALQPVFGSNFLFAAITLFLVTMCSIGKAWLRLNAVRLVLTGYERELRRQLLTQVTLWILAPAVFFYNSVAALFSRRIVWRGTKYKLKSPTETVIITD